MAIVNLGSKEDLKQARKKMKGKISYRKMKDGRIIAATWPKRKRK